MKLIQYKYGKILIDMNEFIVLTSENSWIATPTWDSAHWAAFVVAPIPLCQIGR